MVAAIDVLYHIVDDQAFRIALDQMAERVKFGGHLLVSDVFVQHRCQIRPGAGARRFNARGWPGAGCVAEGEDGRIKKLKQETGMNYLSYNALLVRQLRRMC